MKKAAFTLLELSVVIIIVVILASLAYVNYRKGLLNSKKNFAISNAELILRAEKIYYLKNSSYFFSSNLTEINKELNLSLDNTFVYEIVPDTTGFKIVVATPDNDVRVEMDADGNLISEKP